MCFAQSGCGKLELGITCHGPACWRFPCRTRLVRYSWLLFQLKSRMAGQSAKTLAPDLFSFIKPRAIRERTVQEAGANHAWTEPLTDGRDKWSWKWNALLQVSVQDRLERFDSLRLENTCLAALGASQIQAICLVRAERSMLDFG